jgi:hypothetical protein
VRRKTLAQYKEEAPEIPTNTCPYIDFIQEINKEIKDEIDSPLLSEKLNLADSMLEYIRSSNECLRESSFYWFSKFKSKFK